MIFQAFLSATVPNMSAYGTLHKERNADVTDTTVIPSATAEAVGV
jgi:hypothetical protein